MVLLLVGEGGMRMSACIMRRLQPGKIITHVTWNASAKKTSHHSLNYAKNKARIFKIQAITLKEGVANYP